MTGRIRVILFAGLAALLAPVLAATSGCAAPTYDGVQAAETTLQPWTPTRKGSHPGDLPTTPEVRLGADADHGSAHFASGGPVSASVHLFWRAYSRTFSQSMGETCEFSPSCSRFAVDAIAAGPEGLVLTFARTQRGHLHDGTYDTTETGHLHDPPENYFFWRSDLGLNAHRSTMPSSHAWYVFVRETRRLPEEFFDE